MPKKKDPEILKHGLSLLLGKDWSDSGNLIKKVGRPIKKKLIAGKMLCLRIAAEDLLVLDELVLQAAEKYGIEKTRTDVILFLLDKEYKLLNPKK